MKKRLQIILTEEAWSAVETITNEANQNFDGGSINYSDVINEMILAAKIDIKVLQIKHTSLQRSLRAMASKADIDVDSVMKFLTELKSKTVRKKVQTTFPEVE